jgi:hypothetical protein
MKDGWKVNREQISFGFQFLLLLLPIYYPVKTVLPYVESIYLPNSHLSSYISTYIEDFVLTQRVTQGEIGY